MLQSRCKVEHKLMPITFISRLNALHYTKSTLYKSLKDTKLKITPTCFGSYAIHHQGVELYLTEIIRGGSQIFFVCLVGVWQRNFEPVVCVCTVRRAVPAGVSVGKMCALCGECCLPQADNILHTVHTSCHPALQHHKSYNRTDN